jgi:hypothetical protein
MRDLWTFEDKGKLDAFVAVLGNNEIPYQLLTESKRVVSDTGMIVAVEETDYGNARKLLKIFRRNSTNRNRK